eukprot:466783-Prymnesium_polylepis.1
MQLEQARDTRWKKQAQRRSHNGPISVMFTMGRGDYRLGGPKKQRHPVSESSFHHLGDVVKR